MKYSQFNSVLPYEEKFVLFNSFQNKIIFLEADLKSLLDAAKIEGIDNLESIHPDFFNYLFENRFIVENSINEVNQIRDLTKKIDENSHEFLLTVNPTMNCNFKCWYCYETHIKASRLEGSVLDNINKFISNTIAKENIKLFNLSFFGGEPLLYFDKNVVPLVDTLVKQSNIYNKYFGISFTTNGYLINEKFISYFKEKNISCHLQITLDGYGEEHDKVRYVSKTKGSYTEIIKNIKTLINNHFGVTLRVNYTNDNLSESYKIAEDFLDIEQCIKDKYLTFDFHRVWQNVQADDLDLTLKLVKDYITDNGLKAKGSYSPNNVQDSCYADKRNSATINYNGDLYKCTARDFLTKNRAGYLSEEGNLIWENDYLEKRMNSKFKNTPCLTCKIMPLCNGGCSQHAMEHIESGEDYCIYYGDENEKNKVVYTKVEEIINAELQEA